MSDRMNLLHALASDTPESESTRPFTLTLSLVSGAVFYLQAQNQQDCIEWIESINLSVARKSKLPMLGGVGSAEYGWNHVLKDSLEPSMQTTKGSLMSFSSMASILDASFISLDKKDGSVPEKQYKKGKFKISEWYPPKVMGILTSNVSDLEQRNALESHLAKLSKELSAHEAIREPMLNLVDLVFIKVSQCHVPQAKSIS